MLKTNRIAGLVVLSAAALLSAGCQQSAEDSAGAAQSSGSDAETVAQSGQDEHEHHNLHGWWCTEHGVPEEECARCKPELVAVFKQKGDWCEEHQRPDSQCFICHPEYQAQFAARYEANFGEKPPEPTE